MARKQSVAGDAEKESIAASMVAVSKGFLKVPAAMAIVKFPEGAMSNETVQRRIQRLVKSYLANGLPSLSTNTEPPTPLAGLRKATPRPVVTNPSSRRRNNKFLQANTPPPPRNLNETMAGMDIPGLPETPQPVPARPTKKLRRTSHQKQADDAALAHKRKIESAGFKAATIRIAHNNILGKKDPNRTTNEAICRQINALHGSNIIAQTAARAVKDGRIGTSPLKRGPAMQFPPHIWKAMTTAYTTLIKLEQSSPEEQSTMLQLSMKVNECINAGGYQKKGYELVNRLKKDTADQFVVDKRNFQEQRRVQWTTFSNLKLWFDTWEMTLIELGFARPKHPDDDGVEIIGDLFFFPGQRRRIINFDETDGSLDNTSGQRGGRPPIVFYSSEVSGGATRANKSSYSPTIICGSNAAGEALPPHFQLKSMAQAENQQFPVIFIGRTKQVWGRFGHEEAKWHDCSFGMNEKDGMNAVELDKYINNSIAPLYPDAEDVPGKRVIMKVDSGPGRTDQTILATNRLRGMMMTPGVPNTTGKTQETDQNYGPFKTGYRGNLRTLSERRFAANETVKVTDLPLLVFGHDDTTDPDTLDVSLPDVFASSFGKESNLSAWAKCGAVPLTRSASMAPEVRHEVRTEEGVEQDPEAAKLIELDRANHYACAHLGNFGFKGSAMRLEAPRAKKKQALTRPQTEERRKAIQKAGGTAGKLFHATGGQHMTADDYFIANAANDREETIIEMEKEKKQLLEKQTVVDDAKAVIQEKGAPISVEKEELQKFTAPELKALAKYRCGKDLGNKEKNAAAYLEAVSPETKRWSPEDEASLQNLKSMNIPLRETALGSVADQTANSVKNNVHLLSNDARQNLFEALQQHGGGSRWGSRRR